MSKSINTLQKELDILLQESGGISNMNIVELDKYKCLVGALSTKITELADELL